MPLKVGAGASPAVINAFSNAIEAAMLSRLADLVADGQLDPEKVKRFADAIGIGVATAMADVLTDPETTTVAVTGGTGVIV